VNDVDPAVAFYATHLAFHLDQRPDLSFAILSRGALQLFLSAISGPGGGQQSITGRTQARAGRLESPGLIVEDLEGEVERLRQAGIPMRVRSSWASAASR